MPSRVVQEANFRLTAIKLLHTLVWTLMAGCILALPFLAFTGQFRWVLIISVVILFECAVLAMNRGRCPLTDWAGRFTDDRADNFDIYLPNWLARYNKAIFGTLFVVNEAMFIWLWWARP